MSDAFDQFAALVDELKGRGLTIDQIVDSAVDALGLGFDQGSDLSTALIRAVVRIHTEEARFLVAKFAIEAIDDPEILGQISEIAGLEAKGSSVTRLLDARATRH